MGAVYEVLHLETDRRLALKVMLSHVLARADFRERFRREARIAANVDSEHIVEVFDAGVDDATQTPFLVMELLKGEDLGERLKRMGAFHPEEVVMYLRQTAVALDETHHASIVHRDLKPENLFLTRRRDGRSRIKVLDFGIAKVVADISALATPTQVVGTPLYMAPEQFVMDGRLSPATDIYALGMIAYTLLVGVPYWRDESSRGGNVFAFASVAALGPMEPATSRAKRAGATLPTSFDEWFATATSVSPERRFPSATMAIEALALALVGREIAPATMTPPESATVALGPADVLPANLLTERRLTESPSGAQLGTLDTSESATLVRLGEPARKPRGVILAACVGSLVAILVVLARILSASRQASSQSPTGNTVAAPLAGRTTSSSGTATSASATMGSAQAPDATSPGSPPVAFNSSSPPTAPQGHSERKSKQTPAPQYKPQPTPYDALQGPRHPSADSGDDEIYIRK